MLRNSGVKVGVAFVDAVVAVVVLHNSGVKVADAGFHNLNAKAFRNSDVILAVASAAFHNSDAA